uniref:BTB domain-containing protein n=2 Tax=Timema TaxID=61471 RepID=A0A7R9JUM9_TIMGE|nr:unnamed protein product [Timema genevievae]
MFENFVGSCKASSWSYSECRVILLPHRIFRSAARESCCSTGVDKTNCCDGFKMAHPCSSAADIEFNKSSHTLRTTCILCPCYPQFNNSSHTLRTTCILSPCYPPVQQLLTLQTTCILYPCYPQFNNSSHTLQTTCILCPCYPPVQQLHTLQTTCILCPCYPQFNNSDSVLRKIGYLYSKREMTDVTLIVGNQEFPAHRLILSVSSEVFQQLLFDGLWGSWVQIEERLYQNYSVSATEGEEIVLLRSSYDEVMLTNPHWAESQEKRVVLQESPACASVFEEFLQYFYTGRIHINPEVVVSILTLADKYNIKICVDVLNSPQDLVKLCGDYMLVHIPHAAVNNHLVSWLQYTVQCRHFQVAQACVNFVKWNIDLVANASDFGDFEPDMLVNLLQQNDLVVHNEVTLFNYVGQWLALQRERLANEATNDATDVDAHMEVLLEEVMANIRFPMMSPRQLADLLLSPLTKHYKEIIVERMAIGMSFHAGQKERIEEVLSEEEGRLLFTPRLYKAFSWSSLLSVENFPSLASYHSRTLVFSSHSCLAEHAGDHVCEWVVDIYPKGVWFKKFFLIVWQGTVEVPENVLKTVRLSVTCKDLPMEGEMRARVGILICGVQANVEHIMKVVERNHRFSRDDMVLNFDDLIPFDELNKPLVEMLGSEQTSPYLTGRNRDILKIHIVVAPLTDICSMTFPQFSFK